MYTYRESAKQYLSAGKLDTKSIPKSNLRKYVGISPNPLSKTGELLKIPRAGQLSAKTLAEENLREFQLSRINKTRDLNTNITSPQRIELPVYFNTPRRVEDGIVKNKISEQNQVIKSLLKNNAGLTMSYKDSYNRISANKRLKDYSMLAFACKRAGKHRDEGRAYYSEGVLCDNLGKYKSAVAFYKKFLEVCKAIGDSHGEALAYNCIGVDYQQLAETDSNYYKKAIEMHLKHKEIADTPGKFLAHVNLGIIYGQLGDQEKSNINFQFALRYAVQMSSVPGQKIALEKLISFVENYIELNEKEKVLDSKAYLRLGQLLSMKEEPTEKVKPISAQTVPLFLKAISIADKDGDK